MVTILDRHGKPHDCYFDKSLVKREITWATISPELKRFYREMSEKGVVEFATMLKGIK